MNVEKKYFCPNCGGQNEIDSNFCVYCGGTLHNVQNTTINQNRINVNNSIINPTPEKKVKKDIKLGFLGWAGLIFLGYITLGSANLVMYAIAALVLYFYLLVPNTKNGFNIVFKVIGGIVLLGGIALLALLGICIGMFVGLS